MVQRKVLGLLIILSMTAATGCATSGKSSSETVDPVDVDVSAYRIVDFNVHSSVRDSADAVGYVRTAISPTGKAYGNSRGTQDHLIVDIDLVVVDAASTFTRFLIGFMAGADKLVAKVSLSDDHKKNVGRFRIEAEQNGGMGSSALRGASDRLVDTLFSNLRTN